jgi:hypothetical protein
VSLIICSARSTHTDTADSHYNDAKTEKTRVQIVAGADVFKFNGLEGGKGSHLSYKVSLAICSMLLPPCWKTTAKVPSGLIDITGGAPWDLLGPPKLVSIRSPDCQTDSAVTECEDWLVSNGWVSLSVAPNANNLP